MILNDPENSVLLWVISIDKIYTDWSYGPKTAPGAVIKRTLNKQKIYKKKLLQKAFTEKLFTSGQRKITLTLHAGACLDRWGALIYPDFYIYCNANRLVELRKIHFSRD